MDLKSDYFFINTGTDDSAIKGGSIRRTASLDTVYLKGLFPRDGVFWHRDRATQTEISTSLDSLQAIASANEAVEDRLARLTIRQRRRSCSRGEANNMDIGSQTGSCKSFFLIFK